MGRPIEDEECRSWHLQEALSSKVPSQTVEVQRFGASTMFLIEKSPGTKNSRSQERWG